MKTNLLLVVFIAILFAACTPQVPTQEVEASKEVSMATSTSEMTMTPEFTATLEPSATQTPTVTPTQTQSSCMTLLSPANEAQIPAIGKITFAWEAMQGASFYALNIILPSGATVLLETKATSRDQYMEAFPAAGQYQWKVVAQDRKKNEICSSALATFSKPYYEPPKPTNDEKKKK